MLFYNAKLKRLSQKLRREMTEAEKCFWSRLRGRQLKGFQVYRQRIIGNYIVDFYLPKAKLIIEVDGGQHYTDEGLKKDIDRDLYMESRGLKVLRFSDTDVLMNIDTVIESIYAKI